MTEAEQLARQWIELWNQGKPDDIPLATHFIHTSPFGVMKGREAYLRAVKPIAAANVTDLQVITILASNSEASIRFIMKTPNGSVEVVDWVKCENGVITAIDSFYDPNGLPNQNKY